MNKFWTIRNQGNAEAEVYIYGPIEGDPQWFEDEVTPKAFLRDLQDAGDVSTLNMRINSPGGNVFAGQAIHSIIRRHPARTIVTVDGLAASIASVIAMAGDEIVMPVNSMMMIHDPMAPTYGNSAELRKTAETLDSIKGSLVATYRDRTLQTENKISAMMTEETWMTAEEAAELGFADRVDNRKVEASISGTTATVNGISMDLSRFRKQPPFDRMRQASHNRRQVHSEAQSLYESFMERHNASD